MVGRSELIQTMELDSNKSFELCKYRHWCLKLFYLQLKCPQCCVGRIAVHFNGTSAKPVSQRSTGSLYNKIILLSEIDPRFKLRRYLQPIN